MKRLFAIAGMAVLTAAGGFAVNAPIANAACGNVIVGGNGGGFCDYPPGPDGRWLHCESVYVMGFGGENCFMVRGVPTTVDQRGWVPAP